MKEMAHVAYDAFREAGPPVGLPKWHELTEENKNLWRAATRAVMPL